MLDKAPVVTMVLATVAIAVLWCVEGEDREADVVSCYNKY